MRFTPSAPFTTSILFIGTIDSRIFPATEFVDLGTAVTFVDAFPAGMFLGASLRATFVSADVDPPFATAPASGDEFVWCRLRHQRIPPTTSTNPITKNTMFRKVFPAPGGF